MSEDNDIDMLILNITPRAAPVTFLEEGLFVKCRVNGVPVEEIIPYECVWFIGSMHNPSLRVNLPQEKVIVCGKALNGSHNCKEIKL